MILAGFKYMVKRQLLSCYWSLSKGLLEGEIDGAPPQVFPTIQRDGDELKQAAAAVIEQTDQEDLRTMANAYASTLDAEIKKAGRCAVALLFPAWQ